MENQEKQQHKDFIENLKNLLENSPKGCEFFLSANVPIDDNNIKGVTACRVKGNALVEILANAIKEAPILKKQFELALVLTKVDTDPLGALKDLFENLGTKNESRS